MRIIRTLLWLICILALLAIGSVVTLYFLITPETVQTRLQSSLDQIGLSIRANETARVKVLPTISVNLPSAQVFDKENKLVAFYRSAHFEVSPWWLLLGQVHVQNLLIDGFSLQERELATPSDWLKENITTKTALIDDLVIESVEFNNSELRLKLGSNLINLQNLRAVVSDPAPQMHAPIALSTQMHVSPANVLMDLNAAFSLDLNLASGKISLENLSVQSTGTHEGKPFQLNLNSPLAQITAQDFYAQTASATLSGSPSLGNLSLSAAELRIDEKLLQAPDIYLNFVKGVVDSSDLPLNVSREILQENPLLGRIRKAITSKVLSELKKLQEKERDNYVRFFKEFGKILKIGLYNDFSNQDKLKELAMYESLNGDAGAMISLAEYVSAMPETQEDIYYITAESRSKALASPALEVYRSKGYDVLIMTDPIDEWVMQVLTQYDKKLLKSVAKGDLELDAESRKSLEAEAEQAGKDYAELVNYIKEELSEHVSEVRFSGRLTESPCCLVAEENGLNARMEKFLKSMNQDLPESKRILELNAKHPLIKLLAEELKDAASGEKLKDNIRLLYDQAVLNEGGEIEDLAGFSRRLSALMVAANSK